MTEAGIVNGTVWLALDGEHIQFSHVCDGQPKVDTLPNSVWPVPTDGNVKPSIHCTGCGFHEYLSLSPRPALMDAIERASRG